MSRSFTTYWGNDRSVAISRSFSKEPILSFCLLNTFDVCITILIVLFLSEFTPRGYFDTESDKLRVRLPPERKLNGVTVAKSML